MKKLRKFITLISVVTLWVLTISILAPLPAQAGLQDFSFKSFEADYYLTRDANGVSQLKVVEHFTAQFPDYDHNHGMQRAIPEVYKNRRLNLEVLSVTDASGAPRPFTQESSNDNRIITSRAPGGAFVRGVQDYIITYTERDVLVLNRNGRDEWYWDTVGDQWRQSFGNVTARIHVPADLASKLQPEQLCFTGVYGSKASDCTIKRATDPANPNDTIITLATTQVLQARENASFVLGFAPNTFQYYQMSSAERARLIFLSFMAFVLPPLLALILMLNLWRKRGRDAPGRGVIIAQYEPPQGINPLMASVVLEESMAVKAISASIIDLCIRGVLKLYEVKTKKLIGHKTDYELEIVAVDGRLLTGQERKLLIALFGTFTQGNRVKLSDLKNKLHAEAGNIGKDLTRLATAQGYFVEDPSKVKQKYSGIGVLIMVVGVFPLLVFGGYFWLLGVGLAGLIILLFGLAMPARTAKGVEIKEHLEGLKLFIRMAEADRIKMLQSPTGAEKSPVVNTNDSAQLVKLYEKLLPYAMLFGLEKDWAKQFAGLYTQPPGWYSGTSTFNAIALSHAMGGFSTAAASSFSAPSSSGSSGFGGGGFSGGGGGGGGGGGV